MAGISGRSELSHGLLLAFAVWGRGDRTGPGPCAKLAEDPFIAPNLARKFTSEAYCLTPELLLLSGSARFDKLEVAWFWAPMPCA